MSAWSGRRETQWKLRDVGGFVEVVASFLGSHNKDYNVLSLYWVPSFWESYHFEAG